VRRSTPSLDRVPSRTIRPVLPAQPRIPISQLPRIRRRADAPVRTQNRPPRSNPPPPLPPRTQPLPSTSTSFLEDLLASQERLLNLQNVRMHG